MEGSVVRRTWCDECDDGKCRMFMTMKPCGKLSWKGECGQWREVPLGLVSEQVELCIAQDAKYGKS